MLRQISAFKVETTPEGKIAITQENDHDRDDVILLSPDSVDLAIKFLQEARAELEANAVAPHLEFSAR